VNRTTVDRRPAPEAQLPRSTEVQMVDGSHAPSPQHGVELLLAR